ncbi:MAG: hypothetical protein GXX86_11700, partial [Propionibacterium sp.]|nr:hypothetical protein [Propionibacterium sp.]
MSGPRLVTSKSRIDVREWLAPLTAFLADRVGGPVTVTDDDSPSGSGMSGMSLLFTASWVADGRPVRRRLVARVMPHPDDLPVFPDYDVQREADVMTAVRVAGDLPVPQVLWT